MSLLVGIPSRCHHILVHFNSLMEGGNMYIVLIDLGRMNCAHGSRASSFRGILETS